MNSLYNEILWPLWPIILSSLLLVSTSCWMFITSKARIWVKFIVIPSALFLALLIPSMFVLKLGYSIFWPLPAEYEVLQHRVVIKDNKKSGIEIWLRELKDAVPIGATRLQRTPYSKEMEKVLRQAEKGRKEGKRSRLKRKGDNDKEGTMTDDNTQYKLHLDSPEMLVPKGMSPGMPEQSQPAPSEEEQEDRPGNYDRLPGAPSAGKYV